jgi:hypothetical protein
MGKSRPKTVVQKLIDWCIINAFEAEHPGGGKYMLLNYDEMKKNFESLIEQEKQQIIYAHSSGIRFMAGNTIIPQDVSKQYYERLINGLEKTQESVSLGIKQNSRPENVV